MRSDSGCCYWQLHVVVKSLISVNLVALHQSLLLIRWVYFFSLCGQINDQRLEYWPLWLDFRQGTFTSVGWHVTLCCLIWQVMRSSSVNLSCCCSQAVRSEILVRLLVVSCTPVVEVLVKRPDIKYQLGFSVQNGVVSTSGCWNCFISKTEKNADEGDVFKLVAYPYFVVAIDRYVVLPLVVVLMFIGNF